MGIFDRENVGEGRGEEDNGNRLVPVAGGDDEAQIKRSRQGTGMRTTRADKDTRRGIELAVIVSVSPIPPFVSGFTVNDYGHLTPSFSTVVPVQKKTGESSLVGCEQSEKKV